MNKKLSRVLAPSMVLYFIVMLAMAAAALAFGQFYLAAIEAFVTILLFVYFRLTNASRKKAIIKYIQNTTDSMDSASSDSLNLPLPMAIVNLGSGEIVWGNYLFTRLSGGRESVFNKNITDVFPGFSLKWLAEGRAESPGELILGDRRYRAIGNLVRSADGDADLLLGAIYFQDLTELYNIRDEYALSRPVVAILLVDNYDELTTNLPDNSVSTLNAEIDTRITRWAEGCCGLLRKVERNRYFFVFEARDLPGLTEQKFSILEDIRQVLNPSGIAATLSIGIGQDGATFQEGYSFAALAIETALARGGDQAVIKDRYNFSFFGGRTRETEHRTKVRSRVVANSLQELIGQSTNIFIMGHKTADIDSLGAAVGIQCICRKQGKRAYIVIDPVQNSAERLLDLLRPLPEYVGSFISGQDALLYADQNSLLIVVDTNRPDQVESRELLESVSRVVVIDHHRRAADFIDHVLLALHEPFASSASELVAELLEYSVETQDMLPVEAEAVLAGIVLDTKAFSVRTGGRTFEAAAFLRRAGADTVDVKKLFQNNLETTLDRYKIIQAARIYKSGIAISVLDDTASRVLAAQGTDELLNISGILASFVLYPDGERIIISARSIGEVNVQMILEPLGGGGNAAAAGAQVLSDSMDAVYARLTESIDRFLAG